MTAHRALLLAVLLAAFPVAHAQESPADVAFYKAFYLETALRDFGGGDAAWRAAIDQAVAAQRSDLAARAHAGRARCLQMLGHRDEAKSEVQAALQIDPDLVEARDVKIDDAPESGDAELHRKIVELIGGLTLQTDSAALTELRLIGAPAVPAMILQLKSNNPQWVRTIAWALLSSDALRPAAVPGLVLALDDPDVIYKSAIMKAIDAARAAPDVMPLYERILDVPDETARAEAVATLRTIGNSAKHVVPIARKALSDPSTKVQFAALGVDWSEESLRALLPELQACLSSPSEDVRMKTLHALMEISDAWPDSRATLIRLGRTDPSPFVRQSAMRYLKSLARSDAAALAAATDIAIELLAQPDEQARKGSAEVLRDTDAQWSAAQRNALWNALDSLAQSRDAANVRRDLDRILYDVKAITATVEDAMRWIAYAQARYETEGMLDIAQTAIDQCIDRIRVIATADDARLDAFRRGAKVITHDELVARWCWSAHNVGIRDAQVALRCCRSDDPTARIAGYAALARLEALPEGVSLASFPHLDEDLRAPPDGTNLRRLALATVGAHPDATFLSTLRTLKHMATAPEQMELIAAVAACGGSAASVDLWALFDENRDGGERSAILALIAGVDPDSIVPKLVESAKLAGSADAIADILTHPRTFNDAPFQGRSWKPPAGAVDAFIAALPTELAGQRVLEQVTRHAAPATLLPLIHRALDSKDEQFMLSGIEAARERKLLEVMPRLIPLLEDSRENVHNLAATTLGELKDFRELKASLADFGEAGHTDALKRAREMTKSGDASTRRGAALALGALGDAAGVPTLLDLLQDKDESVRAAALSALEKLGGAPRK